MSVLAGPTMNSEAGDEGDTGADLRAWSSMCPGFSTMC
jgi:hypothetical protein